MACDWSIDCDAGFICSDLKSTSEFQCVLPSEKGEVCYSSSDCKKGLVCRRQVSEIVCLDPGSFLDYCDEDKDCKNDLVCRRITESSLITRCSRPAALNEYCWMESDCRMNLECINHKCRKHLIKGDRCELGIGQLCKYPLHCRRESKNTHSKCLDAPKKGEYCDYSSDVCAGGLNCRAFGKESNLNTICLWKRPSFGELCHPSGNGCPDRADCRRKTPGALWTCETPAAYGESCVHDEHCKAGMKCIRENYSQEMGKCGTKRKEREICELDDDCPSWLTCKIPGPGKCYTYSDKYDLKRCMGKAKIGEFCCRSQDCESQTCSKSPDKNKGFVCAKTIPCETDVSCSQSSVCRRRTSKEQKYFCLPKGRSGSFCVNDSDCISSHCSSSRGHSTCY